MGLIYVETKVLKQLIRDIIQPERDLGHSDRKGHKAKLQGSEIVSSESQGTDKTPSATTKTTVDVENVLGNSTSQFRELAEQACEDCQ